MISVTKLRNGVSFEQNGTPYRVTEYKHTHLSRGGGTIKIKARDLSTGRLVNLTFKSGDNIQDIDVERKELQYLYVEDDLYYFMNPTTFDQVELSKDVIGDGALFLREGESAWVLFWEDKPLDLDLPPNVAMSIIDCAPGEKGNSASNVYKDATVEGGLNVRVPLFINVGDKIRVDTRTREYLERV